jgi:hypothetical protein
MSLHARSAPREWTASEYVLALFSPSDKVAILVRPERREVRFGGRDRDRTGDPLLANTENEFGQRGRE